MLNKTFVCVLRLYNNNMLIYFLLSLLCLDVGMGIRSVKTSSSAITGRGVATTNHSSQKTGPNDLSYGIKIWTDLSSILSQCTQLTGRRTDGQNSHR